MECVPSFPTHQSLRHYVDFLSDIQEDVIFIYLIKYAAGKFKRMFQCSKLCFAEATSLKVYHVDIHTRAF